MIFAIYTNHYCIHTFAMSTTRPRVISFRLHFQILEQGIKSKFHDLIVTVQDEESIEMAKRLAKSEGIFTGISGGATTIAGCKVSRWTRDT